MDPYHFPRIPIWSFTQMRIHILAFYLNANPVLGLHLMRFGSYSSTSEAQLRLLVCRPPVFPFESLLPLQFSLCGSGFATLWAAKREILRPKLGERVLNFWFTFLKIGNPDFFVDLTWYWIFELADTGWVNPVCEKRNATFFWRVLVVTTTYLQVVAENSLFLLNRAIFSTSAISN